MIFVYLFATAVVVTSACPDIYSPVCGKDGRTYSNECYKPANVGVECEGECPCGSVRRPYRCPLNYDPVCATDLLTYPNDCEFQQERLYKPCLEIVCKDDCSKCPKPFPKVKC